VSKALQLILGNQLFPPQYLPSPDDAIIFMAEDLSLCTYVRHHKKKLILFLSAMRNYADSLERQGFDVRYHSLDDDRGQSYEEKLSQTVEKTKTRLLRHFEIEDKFMEDRIAGWAIANGIEVKVDRSPMFLCSRERFAEYLEASPAPRIFRSSPRPCRSPSRFPRTP